MTPRAIVLSLAALGNGYLLGVMVLFATVSYPGFAAVDRAAFPSVYSSFTGRIGLPVVAFEFAAFFATLALYGWRPASTPLWAVHALALLGLAYFAITFGWHLPAHRSLAAGDSSPEALAPLLRSQWARTLVQFTRAAALGWLSVRATS